MKHNPTVVLVDDEPGMLRALTRLLEAEGFQVRSYLRAEQFLAAEPADPPWCLILDVAMPGIGGLELQHHLNLGRNPVPIIFLTGHGDIPMSVRAIKSGAVDFLTKPVKDEDLLRAVNAAIHLSKLRASDHAALEDLRLRFARLTTRERQVMEHVITGKLNKQIAAVLGTSEQTIKVHRMRMMDKFGFKSVVELVRASERLGLENISPDTSP